VPVDSPSATVPRRWSASRKNLYLRERSLTGKGEYDSIATQHITIELRVITMPLFMDVHNHVPGLTAEAVAGAHQKDLEIQEKYGVKYLKYWFDEGTGKVFCLVEAPNKEAAITVHREAHGLLADDLIEVQEGS
jgi:hypothetical protein